MKRLLGAQAKALADAGVDALVVETMRQTSEMRVAIVAAVAASGGRMPVVASVALDGAQARMADGTPPRRLPGS